MAIPLLLLAYNHGRMPNTNDDPSISAEVYAYLHRDNYFFTKEASFTLIWDVQKVGANTGISANVKDYLR